MNVVQIIPVRPPEHAEHWESDEDLSPAARKSLEELYANMDKGHKVARILQWMLIHERYLPYKQGDQIYWITVDQGEDPVKDVPKLVYFAHRITNGGEPEPVHVDFHFISTIGHFLKWCLNLSPHLYWCVSSSLALTESHKKRRGDAADVS